MTGRGTNENSHGAAGDLSVVSLHKESRSGSGSAASGRDQKNKLSRLCGQEVTA